ncbi:MAG: ribonuclease HIII [candidate division Zixibacteria bacterium]
MDDYNGPIIGVDESGKGDFFGPLVIAAVCLKPDQNQKLIELGVKDSKKISDKKIQRLAEEIKTQCDFDVIVINPLKYNQLYQKIKNLNKLLGWGHARAIENILAKTSANRAISDKFGKERFIRDNLQEKGKQIELIQMVRGEAHPAVAAASIVARSEFVRRMDYLSKEVGLKLPLGASSIVDNAGKELVKKEGRGVLDKTAKTHFKNYKKIFTG